MLNFVFRKIESKKWMVISLLVGNLLMIAIAAASPMYSQAVLQRTLTRSLSSYYVERSAYPGLIIVRGAYAAAGGRKEADFEKIGQAARMVEELTAELDVPAVFMVTQYYKGNVKAAHEVAVDGRKNELTLRIASFTDQKEHLSIVNGDMCAGELDGNTFDVMVNERTFVDQNLMLGEVLELSLKDASGEPYRIRIAGIFENREPQDIYWVAEPTAWRDVCLMDEGLFRELFANEERLDMGFNAEWYASLDYLAMRGDQVERYLGVLERYLKAFEEMGYKSNAVYFKSTMENFVLQAQKLNATILILQMPIFVLLAAFIFMVSRQMLEMEQNEIAVYKSRGADKGQIVLVYLLQSLIISVLGLAGGIPLGVLMCRLLGASNSFLEFVKRAALPVEIGAKVWMAAGAAAAFSICTTVSYTHLRAHETF